MARNLRTGRWEAIQSEEKMEKGWQETRGQADGKPSKVKKRGKGMARNLRTDRWEAIQSEEKRKRDGKKLADRQMGSHPK